MVSVERVHGAAEMLHPKTPEGMENSREIVAGGRFHAAQWARAGAPSQHMQHNLAEGYPTLPGRLLRPDR